MALFRAANITKIYGSGETALTVLRDVISVSRTRRDDRYHRRFRIR